MASIAQLEALDDIVVIRPDPPGQALTDSFLFVPEDERGSMRTGTVLSAGPGRKCKGRRVASQVKAGDRVLFNKWLHEELKAAGEQLVVTRERELYAVLEAG